MTPSRCRCIARSLYRNWYIKDRRGRWLQSCNWSCISVEYSYKVQARPKCRQSRYRTYYCCYYYYYYCSVQQTWLMALPFCPSALTRYNCAVGDINVVWGFFLVFAPPRGKINKRSEVLSFNTYLKLAVLVVVLISDETGRRFQGSRSGQGIFAIWRSIQLKKRKAKQGAGDEWAGMRLEKNSRKLLLGQQQDTSTYGRYDRHTRILDTKNIGVSWVGWKK